MRDRTSFPTLASHHHSQMPRWRMPSRAPGEEGQGPKRWFVACPQSDGQQCTVIMHVRQRSRESAVVAGYPHALALEIRALLRLRKVEGRSMSRYFDDDSNACAIDSLARHTCRAPSVLPVWGDDLKSDPRSAAETDKNDPARRTSRLRKQKREACLASRQTGSMPALLVLLWFRAVSSKVTNTA